MSEVKEVKTIINSGTVVGSTFAQGVGVTVNDTDVTLEFIFINPRDISQGQTVARVTLPVAAAIQLSENITITTKVHERKKKGVRNG